MADSYARAYGFLPVASEGARALVLGSMPGEVSLREGQYYAHPRNAFWPIMGHLFGAGPELPYCQRLQRLQSSGVALWDVLRSGIRPGSLDSDIDTSSVAANDFDNFFRQYSGIRWVFFNGGKAEQLFLRHVLPGLEPGRLTCTRLPSTSPAHAAMRFEEKLQRWALVQQVIAYER